MQKYKDAAELISPLGVKLNEYDDRVAAAGFGYTLRDELTWLINADLTSEVDRVFEIIRGVEMASGVMFKED